jgi:hypothetical protein
MVICCHCTSIIDTYASIQYGIVVDDDPDIAEEKLRGEFPWVYDVEDDSNEIAVQGFPVFDMLNKRLFKFISALLWI